MKRLAWALPVLVLACEQKTSTPPAASAAPSAEPVATASAPRAEKRAVPPQADYSKLAKEGAAAPPFEATAHNGQEVSLDKLRGKNVVLYFYPKDDTPGCTIEAKGFRDSHADLQKADTVVVGVSTDNNASHAAFAKKYELPFLLLPDDDETIARAYGVPVTGGYARRVTFLINKEGKIAKVFPRVDPRGHAEDVIKIVASMR